MSQTILVVEDDRDIATVFTELLAGEGYQVATRYDGRQAFEFVRSHAVDLIISDIRMPGMDGVALAAGVRELDSNLPVILVSAVAPPGAVEMIPNLVFLKKPVSLDTLLAAVAAALSGRVTE